MDENGKDGNGIKYSHLLAYEYAHNQKNFWNATDINGVRGTVTNFYKYLSTFFRIIEKPLTSWLIFEIFYL